ncbi:MAG: ABC transporter permease [Chloroflexota bacterium]|nr:MAG: peptide ABC transporter permease [Chloroflexota bacterium]
MAEATLTPTAQLEQQRPARGLWSDAWRRLRQNKAAVVGAAVVLLLVLVAIFADVLAPYPYAQQHIQDTFEPIGSPAYLLGTDQLGRDLLSRLIYGTRISLGVAFLAQAITLAIGIPLGLLAGAGSRTVDNLIMRVTDVIYAFPDLLFVIIIMAVLGRNIVFVPLAIGIVNWTTIARLVRSQVLSLRERDFVTAARALGVPGRRIMLNHMLPNALTPIIVAVTLGVPQFIMLESTLSFIGIGAPPPMPSWGLMINDGFNSIFSYPHMVVLPGLAIALTMLSFAFLGDGLRDALDPRER